MKDINAWAVGLSCFALGVAIAAAVWSAKPSTTWKAGPARLVVFVTYAEADRMMLEDPGWRIAPEEDRNKVLGMVWIEHDVAPVGQSVVQR